MNLKKYEEIMNLIRNHKGLSKDCFEKLRKTFPEISRDTLYSIMAVEYQKKMKINHSKANQARNNYFQLYQEALERNEQPGIILRLSEQFDVTPCLVAKCILQKYLESVSDEEEKITKVNTYLRDTHQIPDQNLALEVYWCTLYDDIYGPVTEMMKQSLGQQYEIKLYHEAINLGLTFHEEEHLRKYGYDKTPDIKLDIPIAIDGFIVNWIESKALFGNEEVHQEYMKNQYLSYWNRFGTGLVIYWFGFLETIKDNNEKRFIIRDCLPKQITKLEILDFEDLQENSTLK